jgi:hypothetical protein
MGVRRVVEEKADGDGRRSVGEDGGREGTRQRTREEGHRVRAEGPREGEHSEGTEKLLKSKRHRQRVVSSPPLPPDPPNPSVPLPLETPISSRFHLHLLNTLSIPCIRWPRPPLLPNATLFHFPLPHLHVQAASAWVSILGYLCTLRRDSAQR